MAPNKKKKKAAANPARGFATVSVASTKAVKEDSLPGKDEEAKNEAQKDNQSHALSESQAKTLQASNGGQTDSMTPEELEQHFELSEIRLAVEKHGAKVKKDVTRQVKALETDRRLLRQQATSLDSASFNESIVSKVIDLVRLTPSYSLLSVPLPTAASGLTPEIDLSLKLWTLQQTLSDLLFPRIEDALNHILARTILASSTTAVLPRETIWGLDEALYWYAVNFQDRELPQFDRLPISSSEDVDSPHTADFESAHQSTVKNGHPDSSSSSKSSSAAIILANISEHSSSEAEEFEDDPLSVASYLELQSVLFAYQNDNASGNSRTESQTLNSSKARRIADKIGRAERDPLFDRREAELQWRSHKRKLEIEIAQAKGRERKTSAAENTKTAQVSNEAPDGNSEGNDGLFSGMFELGDSLADATSEIQVDIPIRDFGKWSGASPRKVLEDICKSQDPASRIVFKLVSTSFHAHRHQIDISWSKDTDLDFPPDMLSEITYEHTRRKTILRMAEIATPSTMQSEAYAATVMLFALAIGSSQGDRPNARLPTVWRHLWTDLLERRAQYNADRDVKRLGELRNLVRAQKVPTIGNKKFQLGESDGAEPSDAQEAKRNSSASTDGSPSAMQNIWKLKESSPAYQHMLKSRAQLPVYKQKSELLEVFNSNQLMILCGETGSGKSTQTPALVLENELSAGNDCRILCTQPRRISAISLAARVSEELGERKGDLGTSRSLVGYAIRLETKVSATTRLTYATTGVAMRLLERQDDLASINVLVIDEVHERNIDSDFLLVVLRRLLPRRPDLRVILMSATIDANRFSTYLNGSPVLMVPGRLFPVQTMFLEDAIEATHTVGTQRAQGGGDLEDDLNDDEADMTEARSQLQDLKGYSDKTISVLRRLNEYKIDFMLVTKILIAIGSQPELSNYSKAILIFMPGIAEMRRLHQIITSYPFFQKGWIFHILHSTVSTEDQQAAFKVPPQDMRKIVIATNIAETGITIPDITAVIDTGKEKIMRFDERRQVSRLTESFISKASSRQRQGRAARVQEGLCVKLYTRDRFERLMPEHSTPEILRLSLSETILRVKLCNLGPIEASLSEALDPPAPKNVRRAIEALKEEKVLTATEELTTIGQQLARLPLDIPLGKLVINGLSFQCLDVMSTVAALMSSKSPFITSVKANEAIDTVRKSFARGDSDLLLLHSAYTAWKRAEVDGHGASFCQKAFLSRQTLQLIEDQKLQLLVHLLDSNLLRLEDQESRSLQQARYKGGKRVFFALPAKYDINSERDEIVNAAIALSFYPRLLRKEGKGWRNISTNQTVSLSPHSVNRGSTTPIRWLSFYQTMQTKGHGLSVSETSMVDDLSIALLLGDAECRLFSGVMNLDNNRFRFAARNWSGILALKEFRTNVKRLLLDKARSVDYELSEVEEKWMELFFGLYG